MRVTVSAPGNRADDSRRAKLATAVLAQASASTNSVRYALELLHSNVGTLLALAISTGSCRASRQNDLFYVSITCADIIDSSIDKMAQTGGAHVANWRQAFKLLARLEKMNGTESRFFMGLCLLKFIVDRICYSHNLANSIDNEWCATYMSELGLAAGDNLGDGTQMAHWFALTDEFLGADLR